MSSHPGQWHPPLPKLQYPVALRYFVRILPLWHWSKVVSPWHLAILAHKAINGMGPSEKSRPYTGGGGGERRMGNNANKRRAKIKNESETLLLTLQKQGFLRDCYEQWDGHNLDNLHEMNEFLERQKL